MKRRYIQWRAGLHMARNVECALIAGTAAKDGIAEGMRLLREGQTQPPPVGENVPVFNCCDPRRVRRRRLEEVRKHAYAFGRRLGWQIASQGTEFETTAEQTVRDAEAYANRGHE